MADRNYGKKIRTLRQNAGWTQAGLAERLGVSTSYLNLIENDRRPLTTDLLLKLAECFKLDLRYFSGDTDAHLVADLTEVFGDAVFEDHPLKAREVADFVGQAPEVARAVLHLHQAYIHARTSAEALGQRVLDHQDALDTVERARLSSEQVSDMLHRFGNYFPELEAAAESLWRDAGLQANDLYASLVRYVEREYRVTVQVMPIQQMRGAVRRFDPTRRELLLSEALSGGSRTFQLAVQIGLLRCRDVITEILTDGWLLRGGGRHAVCDILASGGGGAV
jgi:transcriptional regulator with XRE-family HTH domain